MNHFLKLLEKEPNLLSWTIYLIRNERQDHNYNIQTFCYKTVCAPINTLQIGYPHIQDSSQDKKHDMHPHAAMCLTAPDPTSLLRWAPALPHALRLRTPLPLPYVQWLQTSPPCWGGLWRCQMSSGFGPRLLTGWTPASSRVLRLRTPPLCRGGLQHSHVFCDSLWVVGLIYKERHSWPTYAVRLACFQDVLACF
jgi:hypothetical protein